MEFIHYLLDGILDLFTLIIISPLLPFMRIIRCKKLNTFVEQQLTRIFSEEGPF